VLKVVLMLVISVSLLCVNAVSRTSPPPSVQIEVMASEVSWTNQEFVGHAFICISIPVNSGIKEDCYGFYPKTNSVAGFIGGPGLTDSEFNRNPSRFSRVTVSYKRPITDEQRRAILKLVDEWNTHAYKLTNQSCIDFVNSVAQKLEWKTPPRVVTDFPETFLKKLVKANGG
jgi:hypothetical protein